MTMVFTERGLEDTRKIGVTRNGIKSKPYYSFYSTVPDFVFIRNKSHANLSMTGYGFKETERITNLCIQRGKQFIIPKRHPIINMYENYIRDYESKNGDNEFMRLDGRWVLEITPKRMDQAMLLECEVSYHFNMSLDELNESWEEVRGL